MKFAPESRPRESNKNFETRGFVRATIMRELKPNQRRTVYVRKLRK